ncbi:MAG TPA: redox-sensitive transcriptional activator SoxR [Thermomicrobiales bacterium]|nr:redox-sensitive transcriptional activator SoxR [Thermomicrobiales bacterium]
MVVQQRISTWFTIGELAERTGVAASALRFYEERGLISSKRNASGHRRFQRAMARRVAFITFAQRLGLTLDEIGRELAKLPEDHVPREEDWERLTSTWRTRIDERIAELERLRDSLTTCIGCGCLSLQTCAVMNPHDVARTFGPGPRYWQGDDCPVNEGRVCGDPEES